MNLPFRSMSIFRFGQKLSASANEPSAVAKTFPQPQKNDSLRQRGIAPNARVLQTYPIIDMYVP